MNKLYYSYNQWHIDKYRIEKILSEVKNPHLVSIYRGSLGMGVEFSNILDLPLSIGKFQSYDGNDKQFELLYDAGITEDCTLVILDDILDTGTTLKQAYRFFELYVPSIANRTISITIFGNSFPNDNRLKRNISIHEHNKQWIVFPWEVL